MKEIILKLLDDDFSKFFIVLASFLILFSLIAFIGVNCSGPKKQNQNQINKQNVNIEIRDTLQIDNRNFSIMLIDSIEYLVYKNGSKLEIIKHK
jgi:hypothetical protein